ncbi:MAG: M23 family metallopeptidase, partial [Clostridiales bacterium]|nr:M23 family metallopeptidase [Clostridiales bacterium]
MKQSFKEKLAKVGKFFKKNGYYFLIVICIAAVASMIGVAVAQNNRRNADIDNNITRPDNSGDNGGQKPPVEDEVDPEPVEDKLTFALPSTGEITGHFEFVFNEILGDYRNHDGIDFVAKDGDINVYAAADGVVKRVDYDVLYGYYIEIEHA